MYLPRSFVVTTRLRLVSVFLTVTSAPGTTLPLLSETVPEIVPLVACPWQSVANHSSTMTLVKMRAARR